MACREYTAAQQLYRVLTSIKHTTFSVKAARTEARQRVLSIPRCTLFADDVRFPRGVYVDLSEGTCADLLTTILSALDISERHTDASADCLRRHDDSRVSFMKSVTNLMMHISSHPAGEFNSGIVTRALIESELGIHWTETRTVEAETMIRSAGQ